MLNDKFNKYFSEQARGINESPKKNLEFKIGEIVVYPKHGVGEIMSIENMEIANIKTKFYVVKMEQAKLTIRVPLDKTKRSRFKKNFI